MTGHWFCDNCNDVQASRRPAQGDALTAQSCPTCRRPQMRFVTQPTSLKGRVTAARAMELFALLKVEKA